MRSLRPYRTVGEIGRMVARSAYAQLRYSPVLLCGTLLGMAIVYAAPVAAGAVRARAAAACRRARLGLDGICLPADPALLPAVAVVGRGASLDRSTVRRLSPYNRQCSIGAAAAACGKAAPRRWRESMDASVLSSGKGHRDENFPVASLLIRKRHRPAILAFYRFARAADDVADHPSAKPSAKLHVLERMWRTLQGEAGQSPEAAALRRYLLERNLTAQHGLDLLEAFRRDVTKLRYRNWDELMDYCRYSAAPVGRFVLDVHGESRATWPASDALCAALQVINHLQDCGKDYRALDRVYLPLDVMSQTGAAVESLGATRAAPPLREAVSRLGRAHASPANAIAGLCRANSGSPSRP